MSSNLVQVTRAQPRLWMFALATIAVVLAVWAAMPLLQAGYQDFLGFVVAKQRAFHDAMKGSLSAMADADGQGGALALIVGSFLYGVFHAAGPGHGKVILSTYLLTQREQVAKSLWLAFASAMMQGWSQYFSSTGFFICLTSSPARRNWRSRGANGLVSSSSCFWDCGSFGGP